MDYLQVFIDWSKKDTSRIKSIKQLRFFEWQLGKAIKAHKAMGRQVDGLQLHQDSTRKMIGFIFDNGFVNVDLSSSPMALDVYMKFDR